MSLAGNACRYNFSEFAIKLNEVTPGLEKRLAPTDCRLRPDQHYLELGMYDEVSPSDASSKKHRSEMPGCIAQAAGLSLLNRMLKLAEGCLCRVVQATLHLHCRQPGSCLAQAGMCCTVSLGCMSRWGTETGKGPCPVQLLCLQL